MGGLASFEIDSRQEYLSHLFLSATKSVFRIVEMTALLVAYQPASVKCCRLRHAPFFVMMWAMCALAALQAGIAGAAGLPTVDEWWSKATRIWSGEVSIAIKDSHGLYNDVFGKGKKYGYSFGDTLKSAKWSTHLDDGRLLIISRTPDDVYIDRPGGGAIGNSK
jgi:hypothetical protein